MAFRIKIPEGSNHGREVGAKAFGPIIHGTDPRAPERGTTLFVAPTDRDMTWEEAISYVGVRNADRMIYRV
jgi:hypothetical protein